MAARKQLENNYCHFYEGRLDFLKSDLALNYFQSLISPHQRAFWHFGFESAAQSQATSILPEENLYRKLGHWEAMMRSTKNGSDSSLELRKDLELGPYVNRFWWLGDWGFVSFKSHMVHPQLTNYFNDIKSKNALFFIRPIFAFLLWYNPGLRWIQRFGPKIIFRTGKAVTDDQCQARSPILLGLLPLK